MTRAEAEAFVGKWVYLTAVPEEDGLNPAFPVVVVDFHGATVQAHCLHVCIEKVFSRAESPTMLMQDDFGVLAPVESGSRMKFVIRSGLLVGIDPCTGHGEGHEHLPIGPYRIQ
jgi:hypothetical protein